MSLLTYPTSHNTHDVRVRHNLRNPIFGTAHAYAGRHRGAPSGARHGQAVHVPCTGRCQWLYLLCSEAVVWEGNYDWLLAWALHEGALTVYPTLSLTFYSTLWPLPFTLLYLTVRAGLSTVVSLAL